MPRALAKIGKTLFLQKNEIPFFKPYKRNITYGLFSFKKVMDHFRIQFLQEKSTINEPWVKASLRLCATKNQMFLVLPNLR